MIDNNRDKTNEPDKTLFFVNIGLPPATNNTRLMSLDEITELATGLIADNNWPLLDYFLSGAYISDRPELGDKRYLEPENDQIAELRLLAHEQLLNLALGMKGKREKIMVHGDNPNVYGTQPLDLIERLFTDKRYGEVIGKKPSDDIITPDLEIRPAIGNKWPFGIKDLDTEGGNHGKYDLRLYSHQAALYHATVRALEDTLKSGEVNLALKLKKKMPSVKFNDEELIQAAEAAFSQGWILEGIKAYELAGLKVSLESIQAALSVTEEKMFSDSLPQRMKGANNGENQSRYWKEFMNGIKYLRTNFGDNEMMKYLPNSKFTQSIFF